MPKPKTLADVEVNTLCEDHSGRRLYMDPFGGVMVVPVRTGVPVATTGVANKISITRVIGPLKPLTWEQQESTDEAK